MVLQGAVSLSIEDGVPLAVMEEADEALLEVAELDAGSEDEEAEVLEAVPED